MKKTHSRREILKCLLMTFGVLVALYLLWIGIKPFLINQSVSDLFSRQHDGNGTWKFLTDRPIPIRIGNINGIPIAVPSNYLKYTFAYKDKSIWEARKPGDKKLAERTFDDAVGSFALQVRWPGMKPRNQETEQSFWNRDKPGEQPWLLIGVTAYGPDAVGRDLGWAPVLRGIINRLSERPQKRYLASEDSRKSVCGLSENWEMVSVHYELRGTDLATGLQWAEPVGPGTECFRIWNDALYWQGDINDHVSDLIICYNGKMPNPNSYQKCEHKFKLPKWGASISLEYPRAMLPQWRVLKERTRDLVLGFQAQAETEEMIVLHL